MCTSNCASKIVERLCFPIRLLGIFVKINWEFPGCLVVKDSILLLLWFRFDPWSGNFHMLWAWQKTPNCSSICGSISDLSSLDFLVKIYTSSACFDDSCFISPEVTQCPPTLFFSLAVWVGQFLFDGISLHAVSQALACWIPVCQPSLRWSDMPLTIFTKALIGCSTLPPPPTKRIYSLKEQI